MSGPVALGPRSLPLSPPEANFRDSKVKERMSWGANALAAPSTPGNRMAQVDKSQVPPELRKAAEGMEAMFIDYMMKVMRETVPKNEMNLENSATDIYRGMLDSEYAQTAVRAGGVGLSDQMIAYLMEQRYNLAQGQGSPPDPTAVSRHTGGTHEGQPDRE